MSNAKMIARFYGHNTEPKDPIQEAYSFRYDNSRIGRAREAAELREEIQTSVYVRGHRLI